MKFLKSILLFSLLLFAALFTEGVHAQAVVSGGGGIIKTTANPNSVTSLTNIDQRFSGSLAYDTLGKILYKYDYSLTAGSRWVTVANAAQVMSASAPGVSNGTTISLTNGGGSYTLAGNTPPVGGLQVTVTGTANNLLLGLDVTGLPAADNPPHAGTLGVAMNGWFRASLVNTMGLPPGSIVQRMF